MKKQYVIIAVVSFVILVGFYGNRYFKKKEELSKHHEKTSSMILQVAKKTPIGGITEMGMALNKYAVDHKAYPESLQQLYPEYIYNKALLDEIEWDYQLKADDFFLSKTTTHKNKRLVVSIDKTLRPNFGETIMVSSVTDISRKVNDATKKGAPTKSLRKDVDWHNKAVALWKDIKYTDPKKALGYLNRAISINQENFKAYNDRGIAKMNLGKFQQAINDYNQSIKLNPNYAKAYNNRGIAKMNLGQYKQAINDYSQAIKLYPNYAKAYNNRGIAKMNLAQYQQAINDYKQAIRLEPKFAGAFFNQGFANYELDKIDSMCYNFKKACELGDCEGLKWANKKGLCK
jgi:tetratricopeptide (TPR) repeat protein